MNHLRYSSNEMFSSTNLIRQSKQIFDKLQEKEIEKAVILRDGKPSFIMLDFEFYEKIMTEYTTLQENYSKNKQSKKHIIKQIDTQIEVQNTVQIENVKSASLNDNSSVSEELLHQLDDDFSLVVNDEPNSEIKEFWDK